MKKFLKIVNWIFDWIMNIIFTVILLGAGAWCIWNIFIK